MKRIIIILVFLAVGFLNIYAQNTDTLHYKHGVGFAAGRSTGLGIAYLYQPENLGIQVVIGAYDDDFNIGLSPMYILARDEMINLFIYSGNSAYYGEKFFYSPSPDWRIANSFGVGFEAHQKQFSFNIMGGIASYYWQHSDWEYGFTLEASLLYRLH